MLPRQVLDDLPHFLVAHVFQEGETRALAPSGVEEDHLFAALDELAHVVLHELALLKRCSSEEFLAKYQIVESLDLRELLVIFT